MKLERAFKLAPNVSVADLQTAVNQLAGVMGFAEDALFELNVEGQDAQRQEAEIHSDQFGSQVQSFGWDRLHQARLTNAWMKGMNVTLHLVKRAEALSLSLRADVDDSGMGRRLTAWVDQYFARWRPSGESRDSGVREQERIFGALVLAPAVVAQARQPFLAEDFRGCLQAAAGVLAESLNRLLREPATPASVCRALTEDPPRLLFPEISGPRLRHELEGLSQLYLGVNGLLTPILTGQDPAPTDPAPVLKYLVVISLLVDRLSQAVPNPAVSKGAGPRAAKARSRAKTRRAAPKKSGRPAKPKLKPRVIAARRRPASRGKRRG